MVVCYNRSDSSTLFQSSNRGDASILERCHSCCQEIVTRQSRCVTLAVPAVRFETSHFTQHWMQISAWQCCIVGGETGGSL